GEAVQPRDPRPRVPPDVVSETPVVEVGRSIDRGPERDLGAPVLVKQHSESGRQSRYRASDVQTGGYLVRPTTDQGVREDDGVGFRPRHGFPCLGEVADLVLGARPARYAAQPCERCAQPELLLRVLLGDSEALPVLEVHAGGVYRSRESESPTGGRKLLEHLDSGLVKAAVVSQYVCRLDGDEGVGTESLADLRENRHREFLRFASLSRKRSLLLRGQVHLSLERPDIFLKAVARNDQ